MKTNLAFILILIPLVCISQIESLESNTKIADSLETLGQYKEAIPYRDLALQEQHHSKDF
ncbi:hypothetical protein ESY86_15645 [Subsaximicrobium wynnwilliamsii]|uniref:Tetratricopeptide repeat protein n=1 Tax=Subsaximicrobium wynnwilliamsii TaxID=291179 RepID=A0A5C6ZFV8_9FLAO|nr:hypothetical protein [Subsaximicrobium wynnwilliamsii]TXD82101.1 hypothetical protein ESY87_15235 [Subsaximicrobium wynnwilliamsii]TXD87746.1 hypothetical protein ESY86_15645 [Subsaximicrobium wynnwilliamsii]TXE01557.1 hypothetical protein ESY88_15225 [Subsaximicrobium wynnwilliamsii]